MAQIQDAVLSIEGHQQGLKAQHQGEVQSAQVLQEYREETVVSQIHIARKEDTKTT